MVISRTHFSFQNWGIVRSPEPRSPSSHSGRGSTGKRWCAKLGDQFIGHRNSFSSRLQQQTEFAPRRRITKAGACGDPGKARTDVKVGLHARPMVQDVRSCLWLGKFRNPRSFCWLIVDEGKNTAMAEHVPPNTQGCSKRKRLPFKYVLHFVRRPPNWTQCIINNVAKEVHDPSLLTARTAPISTSRSKSRHWRHLCKHRPGKGKRWDARRCLCDVEHLTTHGPRPIAMPLWLHCMLSGRSGLLLRPTWPILCKANFENLPKICASAKSKRARSNSATVGSIMSSAKILLIFFFAQFSVPQCFQLWSFHCMHCSNQIQPPTLGIFRRMGNLSPHLLKAPNQESETRDGPCDPFGFPFQACRCTQNRRIECRHTKPP